MPHFKLSLSDEVLIAIGSVSAQWATLEFYFARTTKALSEKLENPLSKLADRTAFMERRNAFYEALIWPNVPRGVQELGVDLVDRIAIAEDKRHTIIHGMANEYQDDAGNPLPHDAERLFIVRDHPKHFFGERFTITQVTDVADEIAAINYDMLRLYFHLYDRDLRS